MFSKNTTYMLYIDKYSYFLLLLEVILLINYYFRGKKNQENTGDFCQLMQNISYTMILMAIKTHISIEYDRRS